MRVLALCWLAAACGGSADPELDWGWRYVHERSERRDALERSLVVRDNGYALLRLEHYGVAGGWDDLSEHNPAVRAVGVDESALPVWSGAVPWEREELLVLGRQAFARWPAHPLCQRR